MTRPTSLYGTIPRDALLHPPPVNELRPIELAIALGLSALARFELSKCRHNRASVVGARAISKERELADTFNDEWRAVKVARRRGIKDSAPLRMHTFSSKPTHKPIRLRAALKEAGRHGYRRALAKLQKQPPPDMISIVVSRSALLRAAHLSRDAKNLRLVDNWLDRLRRPVQIKGLTLGAVVLTIEDAGSGRLRIEVSGEWLDKPYGRVPLPLPVRSALATALYLFLLGIDTRHS